MNRGEVGELRASLLVRANILLFIEVKNEIRSRYSWSGQFIVNQPFSSTNF